MRTGFQTMGLLLYMAIFVGSGCSDNSGQQTSSSAGTEQNAYRDDDHNSRNSLDWNGTYKGTIPCADCEGIEISLTVRNTGEFIRKMTYLGKEDEGGVDRGRFEWNEFGSAITLMPEEGEPQMYLVGENVLFHLDRQGNRITGDLADKYQLIKNMTDPRLEDKKWVLIELMGQEISLNEDQKEAYLVFDSEMSRMSGNNSCNNITGSYELKEGDRITFGNIAGTLMACPDMTLADRLNEALGKTDNYAVNDSELSLNRARMAPLARFRVDSDR